MDVSSHEVGCLELNSGQVRKSPSLRCRRVENTVDLDDIVVEQALHLEHGARRIRRLAPEFRLYLAHERREPMQVGYVDREADAIPQCRTLRFGNEFQIQESLTNARLVTFHQFVGGRIDALHAGNKNEVARTRADTPGVGPAADCAPLIERHYSIGRW